RGGRGRRPAGGAARAAASVRTARRDGGLRDRERRGARSGAELSRLRRRAAGPVLGRAPRGVARHPRRRLVAGRLPGPCAGGRAGGGGRPSGGVGGGRSPTGPVLTGGGSAGDETLPPAVGAWQTR